MDEAPPPVPPPELPLEELVRLVDQGDVPGVERALREQNVRLPQVLDQVDRVLALGHGNLAAALATMLIFGFRVARADRLAQAVLREHATAGTEELTDLAAALFAQDRLDGAGKVLAVLEERDPAHGRSLYLRARIAARRGRVELAFERLARVSPKLLGPEGLLVQARYALLAGRTQAAETALRLARRSAGSEAEASLQEVERLAARLAAAPAGALAAAQQDLRAMTALEYGALVVELAADRTDGGRFGMDPPLLRDVHRLLARLERTRARLGWPLVELCYATEDGEIVAAALSERTGAPYRQWRADRAAPEGSWLCMASAATHPHLPNTEVRALHEALAAGHLFSLALLLPAGSRGPLVPDLVGRVAGDDELPWAFDEEVASVLEGMQDQTLPISRGLVAEDEPAERELIDRLGPLLRGSGRPRAPHVPFLDETPVPRSG